MDFRDTPEEEAFRKEVAAWIERALKGLPHERERTQAERDRNALWWQEQLAEGNWAGITWPERYGGRGLSIVHEAIFNEESAKHDAPPPANLLGMILAGPTILVHGTEEQKDRYLPKILTGEEIWCQGFSEPGAGSDLAGLGSRATPVEDGGRRGWLVNGQKVWTSFAHQAHRCMLLARTGEVSETGSKHQGITYFLASTEQFEIRPLVMINGDADFNEMFLSDVFVDDVLGEVGAGWPIALTTLAFERASLAFVLTAIGSRTFQRLVERVCAAGMADDDEVRGELGRLYADLQGIRVATVRQLSMLSAGKVPGAEGSVVKLAWARLMQTMTRMGVQFGGVHGLTLDADVDERWASGYLRAKGNSVEGGTDEVQKSIIAERVLGLPKSR